MSQSHLIHQALFLHRTWIHFTKTASGGSLALHTFLGMVAVGHLYGSPTWHCSSLCLLQRICALLAWRGCCNQSTELGCWTLSDWVLLAGWLAGWGSRCPCCVPGSSSASRHGAHWVRPSVGGAPGSRFRPALGHSWAFLALQKGGLMKVGRL